MQIHRAALREAIQIAGSQAALARAVGKKQAHIWFWLNEAKKFPPAIALKVEEATGVSKSRLCPDAYPEKKTHG